MIHHIWILLLVCPAIIRTGVSYTVEEGGFVRIWCSASQEVRIKSAYVKGVSLVPASGRNYSVTEAPCFENKFTQVQQQCEGSGCIFQPNASFFGDACTSQRSLEITHSCISFMGSETTEWTIPEFRRRRGADELKIPRKYLALSSRHTGKGRQNKLKDSTSYDGGCPHPAFVIKHIMTDINSDTAKHADYAANERMPLRSDIHSVGTEKQSLFYAPQMTYVRQGDICKFSRAANKYDCVPKWSPSVTGWTCTAKDLERAAHNVHNGHYFTPGRH